MLSVNLPISWPDSDSEERQTSTQQESAIFIVAARLLFEMASQLTL